MPWKCCTRNASKFGKFSSGHRTGKGQFSFQFQRKAMPMNVSIIVQLGTFHMLAKKCSKFSKPGFNIIWTVNFQMFKLDLEKAEEPEIKLPTFIGSWRKQGQGNFRKTCILYFIDYTKAFVEITTNCGQFLKRWVYQTTYLSPEKPVWESRSNS